MLPLKSVPKELLHPPPARRKAAGLIRSATVPVGAASTSTTPLHTDMVNGNGKYDAEADAAALLRTQKETDLKSQLIVLDEQKFLLEEMLADARRGRRFDEIGALSEGLDELDAERERVMGEIEVLEME